MIEVVAGWLHIKDTWVHLAALISGFLAVVGTASLLAWGWVAKRWFAKNTVGLEVKPRVKKPAPAKKREASVPNWVPLTALGIFALTMLVIVARSGG